jgi:hypothetical protein
MSSVLRWLVRRELSKNFKTIIMGKAAKFKELRRIANSLPAMDAAGGGCTEIKKGYTCIKEGILIDLAGNPINPEIWYKFPAAERNDVNHYNALRKAYDKGGMKEVEVYCKAIEEYKSKTAAATEPA